jgi:hypothetical protein
MVEVGVEVAGMLRGETLQDSLEVRPDRGVIQIVWLWSG